MSRLPGPPLLGLGETRRMLRRPHLAIADLQRRYGDVVAVGAGPFRWDRPDEFVPERWFDGGEPEPYSFVPFGGGYRRCIGFGLALAEIKVALIRLLQRTSLSLRSTDVQGTGVSSLRPEGGVQAEVVSRA